MKCSVAEKKCTVVIRGTKLREWFHGCNMRLKSQAEVPRVGQQGPVSPLSIFRGDIHGKTL